LTELLNKKFILEVKKNMSEKLATVVIQKSNVLDRRQSNYIVDVAYRIQDNPFF